MSDFEVAIYDKERKKDFMKVFGTDIIPIKSPIPTKISLPSGEEKKVYFLDLDSITHDQRKRLIQHISESFNQPIDSVNEDLDTIGLPILKENCGLIIHNPQRWID